MDSDYPLSTASLEPGSGEREERAERESRRAHREHAANRRVGALLAGRFELTGLLGVGAYGEVYQATDREEPSTPLALKLLRRTDAHALYNFKREFRGLAEVSHPNLVALHELFLESEPAFFTMELVRGEDFLSFVRPDGQVDAARLREALRGLSAGVAALHRSGRLHRDLKPSNVLVEASARVVLVDFGLVTALRGRELFKRDGFVGTPAYAAPEQLSPGVIGPASDWYAVGTMIYEALCGQLPFEGSFPQLSQHKAGARCPALTSVPEALQPLASLCLALLEPRLEARAGLRELESWLGGRLPDLTVVDAPLHAMVGRAEPLAWLERALVDVERGSRVCCVVTAASGLGKTTLVEHFLERAAATRRAVVLQGRCYVNEDVSYGAMDGIADSLAHYLLALPRSEADSLMPRDAQALAQLFPALLRVPSIMAAPPTRPVTDDPSRARERGAKALRELLARLSDRLPLILFVDDLQWDDTDSAWLLATILSEPDAPSLLFVGASRSQSEAPSHVLGVLDSDPALSALLRRCELAPLSADDVFELLQEALGEGALDDASVDAVVRESAGHPLFALELVRRLRDSHMLEAASCPRAFDTRDSQRADASQKLSLQSTIGVRLGALSASARRLLELCCVAGHRLTVRASLRQTEADVRDLRELLALRLASATGVRKHDTLEPYHDRIREAVLAALSSEAVRTLRRVLAELLLSEAAPRYELVVEHYLAAADAPMAARHALAAADEALGVLALHRLPGLLELAFAHCEPEARAALHVRIGEACSLVGRTSDACRHYCAAGELEARPERRWELRRMAMVQAFRGGEQEQGEALLRELDRELGAPGVGFSVVGVLKTLASQLRWLLRGAHPLCAASVRLDERARRRLTLAWSAALGFVSTHVLRSQYYATTAFRLSARLGDVGIYAALRATYAMARGVRTGRPSARVEREIELTTALAERAEDRASAQFVALGRVAYKMYTAQIEAGYQALSALLEQPLEVSEVGAYVRSVTYMTAPTVFFWSGRLRRSREQVGDWIRAARERADVHLEYGLRALAAHRYLCDDEAERAAAEWSLVADRFPGHLALRSALWGTVIGLYSDRIELAERAFGLASRVFLRWNAHVYEDRLQHSWVRGSIAAARMARGDLSWRTPLTLGLSLWLMRLERGGARSPHFLHLRAVRAYQRGQLARAEQLIEQAELGFRLRKLPLFAACASHAIARLHRLEARRREHAARAASVFESERLRCPERWERALLPGLPRPPQKA